MFGCIAKPRAIKGKEQEHQRVPYRQSSFQHSAPHSHTDGLGEFRQIQIALTSTKKREENQLSVSLKYICSLCFLSEGKKKANKPTKKPLEISSGTHVW